MTSALVAPVGTAAVTTEATPSLQVLGSTQGDSSVAIGRWNAALTGPELHFVKSRSATIGNHSIVLDGDSNGGIGFFPDDGVDFATLAASFVARVDDASPAAGDVGMAFEWWSMPGGAGALRKTMELTAAGALAIGVPSGTTGSLTLANSGSAFTTTFQAGANLTASRTYTLPLDFGVGVLTDAAGNGTLTWAAAGGGAWSSAGGFTDPDTASDVVRVVHSASETNAVITKLRLQHITDGTALAGFGVGMDFQLSGADASLNVAASITADWTDPATGAEDGALHFATQVAGAAAPTEVLIVDASTTNVLLTLMTRDAAAVQWTAYNGSTTGDASAAIVANAADTSIILMEAFTSSFTPVGAFKADGTSLYTSVGTSGGLSIASSGENIRFYTNGRADADMIMKLDTDEAVTGIVDISANTALTATVLPMLRLGHNTSGTAAAGFGSSIDWELEGADGTDNIAASISADWTDPATGSEDGALHFLTQVAGAAAPTEALVIDASQSNILTTSISRAFVGWSLKNTLTSVSASANLAVSADSAWAQLIALSSTFTPNGAFKSDGFAIDMPAGAGGLSIVARNSSSGHIRFYTNGFADADMIMKLDTDELTTGIVDISANTALTSTVLPMLRLGHNTSGAAAAGFGSSIDFELEGADTTNNVAASITADWTDPATGAEDGALHFLTQVAGAAAPTEALVIDASATYALDTESSRPAAGLSWRIHNEDNTGWAILNLSGTGGGGILLHGYGSGVAESGDIKPNSARIYTGTSASGGLSITSAHATTGEIRFYTDGATDANHRGAWTNAGALAIGTEDGETTARTGGMIRASDMIGGTTSNAAGADLTVGPGFGTGTGDTGQTIFQMGVEAGAGSTAHTRATAMTIDGENGAAAAKVQIETQLAMAEITEPADVGSYGQLYTTTANDLRFKDGAGIDWGIVRRNEASFYFNAVANVVDIEEVDVPHGIAEATTEQQDGAWTFKAGSNSGTAGTITVTDVANDGAGAIRCTTSGAHGMTAPTVVVINNTNDAVDLPNGSYLVTTISDTTHFDLVGSTFTDTTATADYQEPSQLTAGVGDDGDYNVAWEVNTFAASASAVTYTNMIYKNAAVMPVGTRERTTSQTGIAHYGGGAHAGSVVSGDKFWLSVQSSASNDPTFKYGRLTVRRKN